MPVPAGELVDGRGVTRLDPASVAYWHVELDRHDLILAEGLAAESCLDCGDGARGDYANGGVPLTLHPTFAAMAHEAAYLPIVLAGPEVEAARVRLTAHADAREAAPVGARRTG